MRQRLYGTAIAILGPDALLMPGDERAIDRGQWGARAAAWRATSILGGTSEIQRNIIGERSSLNNWVSSITAPSSIR
jgi:alkylation response protein AidB-like acyl-CoA dehydrogenase